MFAITSWLTETGSATLATLAPLPHWCWLA